MNWIGRQACFESPFPNVPRRTGPTAWTLQRRAHDVTTTHRRTHEATSDPRRHVDGHRIADELPSMPAAGHVERGQRPIRRKALHALGIANVRRDDLAIREDDRRWRRDAEPRASLQRRHRVDCPPEPASPLRPVEPARAFPDGVDAFDWLI